MRLRLVVVPIAERHIRRAADWWSTNRPAAPDLFSDELARAFDLVTLQPRIGKRAREVATPNVRRLHLTATNYYLYYRHSDEVVEILTVWHASRGTAPPRL